MVARKWDKEKVLEMIMSKSENGLMPKTRDFSSLELKAIYSYVGNFEIACEILGLKKQNANHPTRHTKEDVLEIVAKRWENIETLKMKDFSPYEQKLIYRHLGTLQNAQSMLLLGDQTSGDAKTIQKQTKHGESLCWTCQRSAASIDIRCSWDEKLEIPQGAEYISRDTAYLKGLVTITKCPLYVSIRQKSLAETAISN